MTATRLLFACHRLPEGQEHDDLGNEEARKRLSKAERLILYQVQLAREGQGELPVHTPKRPERQGVSEYFKGIKAKAKEGGKQ